MCEDFQKKNHGISSMRNHSFFSFCKINEYTTGGEKKKKKSNLKVWFNPQVWEQLYFAPQKRKKSGHWPHKKRTRLSFTISFSSGLLLNSKTFHRIEPKKNQKKNLMAELGVSCTRVPRFGDYSQSVVSHLQLATILSWPLRRGSSMGVLSRLSDWKAMLSNIFNRNISKCAGFSALLFYQTVHD